MADAAVSAELVNAAPASTDATATTKPKKRTGKGVNGGRCIMARSIKTFMEYLNNSRAKAFEATGWVDSVKKHTKDYMTAQQEGKTEVFTVPAVEPSEKDKEGKPARVLTLDEYLEEKKKEEIKAISLHIAKTLGPCLEKWLSDNAANLENIPEFPPKYADAPALIVQASWFKSPANKPIFLGWRKERRQKMRANIDGFVRHALSTAAETTIANKKVTISAKEMGMALNSLGAIALIPRASASSAPSLAPVDLENTAIGVEVKATRKRKTADDAGKAAKKPRKTPAAAPKAKGPGKSAAKGPGKRAGAKTSKVASLKRAAGRASAARNASKAAKLVA